MGIDRTDHTDHLSQVCIDSDVTLLPVFGAWLEIVTANWQTAYRVRDMMHIVGAAAVEHAVAGAE